MCSTVEDIDQALGGPAPKIDDIRCGTTSRVDIERVRAVVELVDLDDVAPTMAQDLGMADQ